MRTSTKKQKRYDISINLGRVVIEKRYNISINLGRVVIENAFGTLKNRWRVLKNFNMKVD